MGLKNLINRLLPENIKLLLILFINRIRYRKLIQETQLHYMDIENKLRTKIQKKIRFASYVVFDSTFAATELIKLMLNNDKYEVKIVVLPDVSRGKEHMVEQYNATKDFFVNKYGENFVVDGYDIKNDSFLDPSRNFDLIYCANPYDSMVHEFHGIKYLSKQNVLPIYIPYAFQPDKYCRGIMAQLNMSLCWKIFSDTEYSMFEYKRYSINHGKNVVLSGYPKMDMLNSEIKIFSERKKILIAPHHTVNNKVLPLSNFLELKEYFLELPKRYPNVDFIFRPHPLLFINMINEGFWSNDDKIKYIDELLKNNIEYSCGGEYFDLFVKSDAIIHDCSSYIVEYLFVNKPCCFIKKNNIKKILCKLGKKCLKCYNIAKTQKDIDMFIENVCLHKAQMYEHNRKKILPKIKVQYPNISNRIFEEIKF